ncbi:hypothetical protein F444_02736 [Phytophthora nicotianae P1976]|uniref:RxLR effector protein n=1 Tax=Phytophthora nicotianae P1976 TaxID=1317066 RepID=A0A081AWD0_PHYNI|nr:hypothetical protein F444_02736 [Phytophthora nicotianae P1976]
MQTSFIVLRIAVSFIAAAAADTTVIQNSTKAFHHDTDRNQKMYAMVLVAFVVGGGCLLRLEIRNSLSSVQ